MNSITVDLDAATLRDASGAEVALRAQSFAVLRHLLENAGRVVSKDELAETVWRGVAVTDDSLVQCIRDIRRALGDGDQTVIRTVPRLGYRLALPDVAEPKPRRAPGWRVPLTVVVLILALAAGTLSRWWPEPSPSGPPTIAVLPFDDMSAEQDLAYLGDGISEDLIATLSMSPDVAVIARNSSFRYRERSVDVRAIGSELGADYVLEGSVRREGGALRITAQLNDARDGRHVWARRFDEASDAPTALRDAVIARILTDLVGYRGAFRLALQRAAWARDGDDLDAYTYHLRAQYVLFSDPTRAGNHRAEAIAREGLRHFPDSAMLKAKLGWVHWRRAYMFLSDDAKADILRAGEIAREVLAMDTLTADAERYTRWLLAYVLMSEGNFDAAVAEAKRTLALAPYDAQAMTDLTEILIPAGEYDLALAWLADAEKRNPADPDWYHGLRGWIYRLTGRYADSVAEFAAMGEVQAWQHMYNAVNFVRLGQPDAARAAVVAALRIDPTMTLTSWRATTFYRDPAILEGEIADLRTAGLPE